MLKPGSYEFIQPSLCTGLVLFDDLSVATFKLRMLFNILHAFSRVMRDEATYFSIQPRISVSAMMRKKHP